MKINFNKEDNTKFFYRLVLVIVSILFFFMVYRFDGFKKGIGGFFSVISPIIFGGVLAYLLNIPLSFLEEQLAKIKFYKKLDFKKKRVISLALTYILVLVFIILFFSLLIPQLIKSISTLSDMISNYLQDNQFENWGQFFNKYGVSPQISDFLTDRIAKLIEYLKGLLSKMAPVLTAFAQGVVSTTVTVMIGLFVSLYILNDKEHFSAIAKKTTYAIFPTKVATKLIKIIKDIGVTVKYYLSGNLIASIILGVEVSVVLFFLGVEGVITMGVILIITNMIPFIGPWMGSVPVFMMIAVQDIKTAFIFIALIVLAQQIDENIVKPRIQSEQMGINSFWIILAIIIGGSLFGVMGMIIGVPIFAVLYKLFKELIEYVLNRKNLPTNSGAYLNKKEILKEEGK